MPRLRSAAILVAAAAPILAAPACAASTGAPAAISLAASGARPAAAGPATARLAAPPRAALPARVVGGGTAASCTSRAVVRAVAKGGLITFNCGPAPVTITMQATARVDNRSAFVTLDGGGKVTLSGGGKVRILYQDTCDQAQTWTTSHCQNQDTPALTVQNLTFVDGNSTGELEEGGGGGAILVRGGRFKIVNSRFFHDVCDPSGPDLGGAAVRVLSQYNDLPVYVVDSTFGGSASLGGQCSNGGGLSSIGVSYTVLNSFFDHNQAIGDGANPAQSGTPGGGSGGAIYNDGDTYTLTLCGVKMTNNSANEGGGAIFFVSNDGTGSLVIQDSTLSMNKSGKFETQGYPGIFWMTNAKPTVTGSMIQ